MFTLLVAEDDKNLQKLMAAILRQNGYNVITADDGLSALNILYETHVDLLICDIMMPKMNGYELTQDIRQAKLSLPILMVTAKETLDDKRKGFYLGTDDYMVKPIDMDEMLLRVTALLRRSRISTERKLLIGNVELNYDSLTMSRDGTAASMPHKEFLLLFKLLSYPGQIFTRQQLMDEIWGKEVETDERTVDVHIKRLREKLRGDEEFEIQTVRGLGYRAERVQ
ncbi:MAG: DNA-binding response regulator [Spirochaetaceae bacterium]|nr:MAG: DNA-binding response regulator [Spirochaetaceae bacterium]